MLGEMENISSVVLVGTSIEELSFSFQNITGLRCCTMRPCAPYHAPRAWKQLGSAVFLTIKLFLLEKPYFRFLNPY